jgi:hypothetical protein
MKTLTGDELKLEVFRVMRQAALAINSASTDDPQLLEVVPRLAQLVPVRPELSSFREAYSALARACGLWNYIDKANADESDALLAETVSAPELGGITLHREQIAVLNDLLAGKNLILSAPTSFGKSLLVDALLASGKYRRVAIVLPTIALLDEFRRRLRKRFGEFSVVMHPSDVAGEEEPTIFLGTQERLINREDLGTLDLTVVDEFYKLDPRRKDERSMTLNAAVYRLLNRSRQFFFLGPNIDNVQFASDARWKFEFLRTRFSTVAVDTFDLSGIDDKQLRLVREIKDEENWPTLVFVSAPDKANELVMQIADGGEISSHGKAFAAWLANNIGPRAPLVNATASGFAIHHGRVPRAIASHMVRLFNDQHLPVLFCTSTLIEGVNTAAKSVLIFDKKINKADYDFFTFSNIRGRAGRLGQHHVGKVFLFNEPPAQEEMEVAPTLFAEDEDAPDDYVVHLEEIEASSGLDGRLDRLRQSLGLDRVELRTVASIGLESAIQARRIVSEELERGSDLMWTGYPTYDQIKALAQIAFRIRRPGEFGAWTASQLTYYISRLRQAATIREFLLWHDESYEGDPKGYDNVFKFLRACEYGLPQIFAVIEVFVKKARARVDYSLFLRELSRWFTAEELKNLDEEGVPIQISERFFRNGETRADLILRLEAAVRSRSPELSDFERHWLAASLDIGQVQAVES